MPDYSIAANLQYDECRYAGLEHENEISQICKLWDTESMDQTDRW